MSISKRRGDHGRSGVFRGDLLGGFLGRYIAAIDEILGQIGLGICRPGKVHFRRSVVEGCWNRHSRQT